MSTVENIRIDISNVKILVGLETLKRILSKNNGTKYNEPFKLTIDSSCNCKIEFTPNISNLSDEDKWVLNQAGWIKNANQWTFIIKDKQEIPRGI